MRKILQQNMLLLFILLSVIGLIGCGKKFKIICSVKFTTAGVAKTEKSMWYILTSADRTYIDWDKSTKAEYDSASERFKLTDISGSFPLSGDLSSSSKTINPHGLTDNDIGETLYVRWVHGYGISDDYFKSTFKGIYYSYLEIKVINDTSIIIRRNKIETSFSITSLSITYFN